MMEKLLTTNKSALDSNLVRIADLIYFEGPLLVLYQDIQNDNFYLYDWVDHNNDLNRWLIYRVDYIALNEYINGKINQFELYNSIKRKKKYIAEIGKNKLHDIFEIDDVPIKYLPPEEYFDISDSNNISKVKIAILKVISRRKSENEYIIPHAFSNIRIRRDSQEKSNNYFHKNQYPITTFKHELSSVKIIVEYFNQLQPRNSNIKVRFNPQRNSILNKRINV